LLGWKRKSRSRHGRALEEVSTLKLHNN
jgi:hypothetical protein